MKTLLEIIDTTGTKNILKTPPTMKEKRKSKCCNAELREYWIKNTLICMKCWKLERIKITHN